MESSFSAIDITIIAVMHDLRRQEKQAIDILRFLKDQQFHTLRMMFHFVEAFGFTESDVGSITYWGSSRSDENINLIIETRFAEKRIGGYLRIDRVAPHLGITPDRLRSFLEHPNYRQRVSSLTWNTGSELRSEAMINPDLLIELEQRFPDPKRPPWWFWHKGARNQDTEEFLQITGRS
jgi:hypothetical protein